MEGSARDFVDSPLVRDDIRNGVTCRMRGTRRREVHLRVVVPTRSTTEVDSGDGFGLRQAGRRVEHEAVTGVVHVIVAVPMSIAVVHHRTHNEHRRGPNDREGRQTVDAGSRQCTHPPGLLSSACRVPCGMPEPVRYAAYIMLVRGFFISSRPTLRTPTASGCP